MVFRVVREPSFVKGRSVSKEEAFWRFDRCSHGNSVKFVASVCSVWKSWGPSDFVSLFQVQLVMVRVSRGLAMYRLKLK